MSSSSVVAKNFNTLVRTMQKIGDTEITFKELVRATSKTINWGTGNTPYNVMHKIMKHDVEENDPPFILRPKQGVYSLFSVVPDHNEQPEVEEDEDEEPAVEETQPQTQPQPTPHLGTIGEMMQQKGMMNKLRETVEPSDASKHVLDSFRTQVPPIGRPINTKKRNFHVGDIVEGYVNGVELYGAFVENADIGLHGLIHKSQTIEGAYNTIQVAKVFQIGDKVTCKVISIRPDGKCTLSTRGFDLPDHKFPAPKPTAAVTPLPQIHVASAKETEKKPVNDKEIEEVVTFMKSRIGIASNDAIAKLRELLKTHGLFPFMMGFTRTAVDFKPDISLVFAEEIEKNITGGSL